MSIDNSIVKKISKLSKLKIRSDSEDKMAEELNNILNWVESLQEVNTEEIEPLLSVLNEKMPLRDDEVVMDDNQGDILNNAPEKKSGFFVVPKVVEWDMNQFEKLTIKSTIQHLKHKDFSCNNINKFGRQWYK